MKQVTLIKTDGQESIHEMPQLSIREIRNLVDYDTFDTVNLRDGRVMMVDDMGHVKKDRPPLNHKATELYHSVCKPGTTWPILGDVVICNDADWE